MAKYDYDMIVIGGGAAGLTASTFAGQSAAKTLLIEKEEKLGGDCLHFGCVPSKTLIKSAYAYNVMRHAQKYGLPKVDLPKVDFTFVRDRIKRTIDKIQAHDEPEYLAEKFNVETRFGSAKFLDQHTIELNGEKITGRYFVLAMGSSPVIPPIEGIQDVSYLTNIQIFSLDQLAESMIVLGGGPIGMEMAQSFARLGTRVIVVEYAKRVLAREDQDVSDFIEKVLVEEGIELRTNTKAIKVRQENGEIILTVEKDGVQVEIKAEKLLIATGRKPNIEGLDLEKADVVYDKRGIKVDHKMRTSTKHICACGDVNGSFPFTHVASYEAVIAVTNMILKIPSRANYTNVPWCTYLDPEVASIGYNEMRAKEKGIKYQVFKQELDHNDRALAESENHGFIKMILSKGRVIGVQIVGFHAGDLISEWIPILNTNGKIGPISNSIHPYPTMAEINKNASVNYFVSTVPALIKKLTKILFGYQGKV